MAWRKYPVNENSIKIYDYLYKNANIFMNRKKNKFNKHLN